MQFEIEVCPRPPAHRSFVAYYKIEAATEPAAIAAARQRFQQQNPDKDIGACEFRSAPKS